MAGGKSKRDWRCTIALSPGFWYLETRWREDTYGENSRCGIGRPFDIYAFRPNKRNAINTRRDETHQWKQIAIRARDFFFIFFVPAGSSRSSRAESYYENDP